MPLTKDVGKNITELKQSHPDWNDKRQLAVALEGAREAGNRKIGRPPSSVKKASSKRTKKGR